MEKRKNDKWQSQHTEGSVYQENWWLDEEDSEELPVFELDEAEDYAKHRQRLTGEPVVTGYEALERRRGVRRPRRKLTRREKRALKKAQKYEEKLHKTQEKEDKKRAKQEEKQKAREEKAEEKRAKKEKNRKQKPQSSASAKGKSKVKSSSVKKAGSKGNTASKKEKKITAQQSIPYREMGKDGICRVEDGYYSKTIRFYDINYQLAQNEDKNTIFENWCDFLNYFDSTIHFQLSFINHHSNMMEYEDVIRIKKQNDSFDDLRMEFAQMLRNQLAKGNNGLVRTKYLTFGIEADNIREAKPKLERIETDILNNFKVLGVSAYPLNGVERLQIMYETFNQDNKVPFRFSYDDVLRTGLNTKDYIAPSSFVFKNGKDFQMGDTIGAVSYLQILAPELTDKMLAEFLEMDCNLLVNLHIQSIDQMKAIKLVKAKVTDINRMKIEEQKKAVRSGYDMDIIPSDLNTYGGEAKRLLEDLQSRNERMFLVTVVFLNTAKNKQELENVVFQTAGIAQKYNCALKRLDYQQEPGLMSSLPLGKNWIPIKRALTTTSTAIFVPFTTQELFMGDICHIKRDELRRHIAMVLQDTHLFTGTVMENIRYGRLDATDEEVVQAAKMASAHSFIMRLPKGYDTVLESDGANLSQGQRQLLNIARAAVSKAPILILDEATSSVDTRTEKHIEQGMDALMAERTTFVIAHRLSTVRNANAIMVLENGEIIERGDHEDLLKEKGRYYRLYTGMAELS